MRYLPFCILCLIACGPPDSPATYLAPSYAQGESILICVNGPATSESAERNPFLHYRMRLALTQNERTRTIPGYYAADGSAADSGADAGNVWCVRFHPETPGTYSYALSLSEGDGIALTTDTGTPLVSETGTFEVVPTDDRGVLRYDPSGYPKWSNSGEIFLKGGTNSPENMLAFADIDGTYSIDSTKQYLKTYPTHVADWQAGDPTWQGTKGKGLIGGLNYLASQGVNSVYFLTMNIGGDARDVFPYPTHTERTRFDVSKLDQWNRILTHAQEKGILLHFVTQETENETLLDGGDTGTERQLYYRELVARFGHHPALVWDLGEENGQVDWNDDPAQTDAQRRAMIDWFAQNDPYQHPVLLHTQPHKSGKDLILPPLLGNADLDGLSLQIGTPTDVYSEVRKWRHKADSSGHRWLLTMDEIGPWYSGSLSDDMDPAHDTLRQEVLYGALMAGCWGVEWYFGWHTPQNDLNAEDWRTREKLWQQTKIALDLFRELPVERMQPVDHLVTDAPAHVLAVPDSLYLIYLPKGRVPILDFGAVGGAYAVTLIDPRTGERSTSSPVRLVRGGTRAPVPVPQRLGGVDWLLLLERRD